jgi:hypothetical protein
MQRDEVDSWLSAYEDYDCVDDGNESGDYHECNEYNLIIECKSAYFMPFNDMENLFITYYVKNPWGASNIDNNLLQYTNYKAWRDQLPKSYSGRLLARCCAIVEYLALIGDLDCNTDELVRSVNEDLLDGTTWWQCLDIMNCVYETYVGL